LATQDILHVCAKLVVSYKMQSLTLLMWFSYWYKLCLLWHYHSFGASTLLVWHRNFTQPIKLCWQFQAFSVRLQELRLTDGDWKNGWFK